MRARWLLVWAGLWCAACSTYTIQQSSLVPPAVSTPVPASAPGADFAFLGSYLTTARDRAWLRDSSLWVARQQYLGTFEYAFRPASLRITGFSAPSTGALRAQPSGLANPGQATWGAGPGFVIRLLRDHPTQNLTLTGDFWLVIAPSSIRSTCIENCEFATGAGARVDRSAAVMLSHGLQYRNRIVEQFGVTFGLTFQTLLRNREVRPESTLGGRSRVRMGAPHPVFDLGVEWTPMPWVTFSPVVGWIAPPAPMLYGPHVQALLRFHIPQQARSKAPPPPARALAVPSPS